MALEIEIQPARSLKKEFNAQYTSYLDPQLSLEERLVSAYRSLEITSVDQEKIYSLLSPLRIKHLPTYQHSIRVALNCAAIATFLNLDVKAAFQSGLLHDVGKAQAPLSLLEKTSGWTSDDSKMMQDHVMDGYRMVRDVFDFSAEILLWHHRFQPAGYPEQLPNLLHPYSEGTKVQIMQYGRIVALADSFDSLHRINDYHGTKQGLKGQEIKEKMLAHNPDKRELVELLFDHNVLTTFIVGEVHHETAALDQADTLYDLSFSYTPDIRSPKETRRFISIAAALEPVTPKQNCTSRYSNCSPHLRMEYFLSAAISIGDAFERMCSEIDIAGSQPEELYKYAFEAQIEGKRNRRGGRINQGIIELLVPIVSAQHLYDRKFDHSLDEILRKATDVLSKTSRKDIDHLVEMKEMAYALCHYDRKVAKYGNAESVSDYYLMDLANSVSATSKAHNSEFIGGFPTVKTVAQTILNSKYPHLSQKISDAFIAIQAWQEEGVAVGFLADCIGVGAYLALSQNPKLRLIG